MGVYHYSIVLCTMYINMQLCIIIDIFHTGAVGTTNLHTDTILHWYHGTARSLFCHNDDAAQAPSIRTSNPPAVGLLFMLHPDGVRKHASLVPVP